MKFKVPQVVKLTDKLRDYQFSKILPHNIVQVELIFATSAQ
jgi:hypothetical protein